MMNLRDSRTVGVLCAIVAALLGLAYMSAAGAPFRYLGINAGALALGLATVAMLSRLDIGAGRLVFAAGVALLATALFGTPVEGATRWVRFGPLSVQVSLLLLPAMIVAFARHRSAIATAGLCLAALGLAVQPDRAMAGTLAASLLVLALARPDRWSIAASAAAVCAFGATLLRTDSLPAVPYVDQILYSSFSVHALAGAAVVGGACLLLIPAIRVIARDPDNRPVHLAFGAAWLGVIAAAALGNYPTPVVGYGGSAILGYLLSLSFLPRSARSVASAGSPGSRVDERMADDGAGLRLRPAPSV